MLRRVMLLLWFGLGLSLSDYDGAHKYENKSVVDSQWELYINNIWSILIKHPPSQ